MYSNDICGLCKVIALEFVHLEQTHNHRYIYLYASNVIIKYVCSK